MRDRPQSDMQIFYERQEHASEESQGTLLTDAAITMQRAFRRKKAQRTHTHSLFSAPDHPATDSLREISVDESSHTQDFLNFAGNELTNPKVKRSVDYLKIRLLAEALNRGDWDDAILHISQNVFYSLRRYIWLASVFNKGKLPPRSEWDQTKVALPFIFALDNAIKHKELKLSDEEILTLITWEFKTESINAKDYFLLLREHNLLRFLLNDQEDILNEPDEILFNELFENNRFNAELEAHLFETLDDIEEECDRDKLIKIYDDLSQKQINLSALMSLAQQEFEALPTSPHLFYALSAYAEKLITREQLDTVILRHELAQNVGPFGMIRLIDEKGHFTAEAKECFAQVKAELAKNYHNNPTFKIWYDLLDDKELMEKFRLNLLEVPESERILFAFDLTYLSTMPETEILGENYFPSYLYTQGGETLIFANGAADALGVALHGPENYIKPKPTLGRFSLDDIEAESRKGSRLKSSNYPGSSPTFYVHRRLFGIAAKTHDDSHAAAQNMLGKDINEGLDHLIDTTRAMVGSKQLSRNKWSAEIWFMVDRPYFDLISHPKNKPISNSEMFYTCVFRASKLKVETKQMKLISKKMIPLVINGNVLQLMFALELTTNSAWWQKRKINAQNLVNDESFLRLLDNAHHILPLIKNDERALQVIKLGFYSHFKALDKTFDHKAAEELFSALDEAYKNGSIKVAVDKPQNTLKITHLNYFKDPIISNHAEFIKLIAEQKPSFKA